MTELNEKFEGKMNEWKRIHAEGGKGCSNYRFIEVFQKGEPKNNKFPISLFNWRGLYEYKVHVLNKSGNLWKRFEYIEDVDRFLSDISSKIFWSGKFFNNRSEAIHYKPFTDRPFGFKRLSKNFKRDVINYTTRYKRSTYDSAKKFNKSSVSIYQILRKGGCKFIKEAGHGYKKGYWTKTQ